MANYGQKNIHLDQWYTRDDWAQACVDDLLTEMPELRGRDFLEPSAGGGAFIRALETRGQAVEGYDLEPRADGIIQADFLKDSIDCSGKVVIGNPPYGKANALSRRFIQTAFRSGATHVAFILPVGYLRQSLIITDRRLSYFKLIDSVRFVDDTGDDLGSPLATAWCVFSSERLQDYTQYFSRSLLANSDSFWISGSEHSRESIFPQPYDKSTAKGVFSATLEGKKRIGISYKKATDSYPSTDVLKIITLKSGNGIQPSAEVANFHLTHPYLYRGTIGLA